MDAIDFAELAAWPEFLIAEGPDHGPDALVNPGLEQPDWWTYNGPELAFEQEAPSHSSLTSAAELLGPFGSGRSDSSPIQRSAQSSQDQLAKTPSSQSLPTADNFARAKSSPRLPLSAVKALRLWLYQHQDCPYPMPDERVQLEQQTGLSKSQVLNWFANARRRRRKHYEHDSALMTGSSIGTESSSSPLERWKQSPPESEPAATSDIMRALENAPHHSEWNPACYSDPDFLSGHSSGSSGSSLLFGAPSMSVFENSCSSGSDLSIEPVQSHNQRPPTPIAKMGKRYRRRKTSRLAGRLDKSSSQRSRMYQCTFCCDSFRSKYDWTRHEKAIHISIDRWLCAPEGGIIDVDGVSTCVFCHEQNADEDHLETHNYLQCRDKPPALREFARKDHLRQHLRSVHNVQDPYSPDRWRISFPELHSRCGFCNSNLTTWDERGDHLAEHFKSGADMSQWTGTWGFDAQVELEVRNAMPPWLLGQERATMDPMKISDANQPQDDFSSTVDCPKGVDLYMILRNSLISYIQDQLSTGIYPSDEMIQSTARLMIYGSDDPWNQTFAENLTWLAALKNDVRFGTTETLPGYHITVEESSRQLRDGVGRE